LGAALEELKKRIFDLDVMKSKEFKMTKIQEFLNFLLSQKGTMFFLQLEILEKNLQSLENVQIDLFVILIILQGTRKISLVNIIPP
jgi:hypothetical protein